ncbi:MAG: hypothetical protein RBT80_14230 [Candidatus Vecturithrix sp.]|nr:hypothetical protein [Candidatus Vecturithrix sp.]
MHTLTYQPQDIKYIVDDSGKRREVILPFPLWKQILSELKVLQEKQRLLLGLQQACREVKLQQQGKLPEQSLEEFISEL